MSGFEFSFSLFGLLFFPIIMLPRSISTLVTANVSLRRIEAFLQEEELDADATPAAVGAARGDLPRGAVLLEDAWLTWEGVKRGQAGAAAAARVPVFVSPRKHQ